jgi:hypothetical protein
VLQEQHTDFARSIVVTPDGRLAASAGQDALLVLWDLGTATVHFLVPSLEPT